MRVLEALHIFSITLGLMSCGRTAEYRRSEAAQPAPPTPLPPTCEYHDIPGQAEFIDVYEQQPRDAANEDVTFSFKPDLASDFKLLSATFDQTNGDGKITVAVIPYPRSCIVMDKVAVGTQLPMTWRTTARGACDPLVMTLPSLAPGCQKL